MIHSSVLSIHLDAPIGVLVLVFSINMIHSSELSIHLDAPILHTLQLCSKVVSLSIGHARVPRHLLETNIGLHGDARAVTVRLCL